jgi:hypothetical protein
MGEGPEEFSKIAIGLINRTASLNMERCKVSIVKDSKGLCHWLAQIMKLNEISCSAEEYLSAVYQATEKYSHSLFIAREIFM